MDNIRPGVYNINIIQGEEFDATLVFTVAYTDASFPIDDSNQAVLQVKEDPRYPTLFTLKLGNGLTIVDENSLRIYIAPPLSRKLTRNVYHYDLLLMTEDGAKPRYMIRGQINVINTISIPQ